MKHNVTALHVMLMVAGLALMPERCIRAEEAEHSSVVPLVATESAGTEGDPDGDLVHLANWIGDAAIVGLGEGRHGTHTLHRLAHRIFQHLVESKGFGVFALEIDQTHAAILDEYVQGDLNDLDRLMAGGAWGQKIFYDEALEELLRWMRHHNETAERPLRFAGYDVKQPQLASERLIQAIAGVDPKAAEKTHRLLSDALALGAFGLFPNVSGYTGIVRTALPKADAVALARVEVVVGGGGVDYGTVGFSARAGTRPSVFRYVPLDSLQAAGSTYSIELEVPATADALELSVFHRGNGTVWFERPTIFLGDRHIEISDGFNTVEVRPLMMPALQRMDYRADLVDDETSGRHTLRITADPLLDKSLEATRAAGRHVEEMLLRIGPEALSKSQTAWVRQLSRLVTQAVEWRTLTEPNRDVFLAENLLWLQRTAFPGQRILALGHTSHTERRSGRMGAYVAEALGDAYWTVSMAAGSGSYRYFGDVSTITDNATLQLFEIKQERLSDLEAAVGKLHSGIFLVQLSEHPKTTWALSHAVNDPSRPDAMIFVRGVGPLLRLP